MKLFPLKCVYVCLWDVSYQILFLLTIYDLCVGMYCTSLERLDLSGVPVTQNAMKRLSQRCPELKVYTAGLAPTIHSVKWAREELFD